MKKTWKQKNKRNKARRMEKLSKEKDKFSFFYRLKSNGYYLYDDKMGEFVNSYSREGVMYGSPKLMNGHEAVYIIENFGKLGKFRPVKNKDKV